jgi:hypothetical protein
MVMFFYAKIHQKGAKSHLLGVNSLFIGGYTRLLAAISLLNTANSHLIRAISLNKNRITLLLRAY